MSKHFLRLVAVLLVPALISNPVLAAGFAAGITPAHKISIPAKYGSVTEIFNATQNKKNHTPLVVVIQDLHANSGVQRNVAEILKSVSKRHQNLTVFVEGASGPFDVSILRNIQNPWVKKKAVDLFLNDAKLTGPEIAAIESETPMHLWGVDDKALYIRNLLAFAVASAKNPAPHPKNPAWQSYYQIARERNIPLSLNTLSHLDLLSQTAAQPNVVVAVFGGYHTEGVTQFLKAQNISYELVTPVVERLGEEQVYVQRMRALAFAARQQTLQLVPGLAQRLFVRAVESFRKKEVPAAVAALEKAAPASTRAPGFFSRLWKVLSLSLKRLGRREFILTIPALVPALAGVGSTAAGIRIKFQLPWIHLSNATTEGGGQSGDGMGLRIEPNLLKKFGGLFGDKKIKQPDGTVKKVNVGKAIADVTREVDPLIAKALTARHEVLESPAPVREKYAFPWKKSFTDADGNVRTFREIVLGMIHNFLGIESEWAWRMNDEVPIPADANPLKNPGLEITGPMDLLINQLNADVAAVMPDLEDASMSWQKPHGAPENQPPAAFTGMAFQAELLAGKYDSKPYVTVKKGQKREYKLNKPRGKRPAMFTRVPSIHLRTPYFPVDGRPAPQIVPAYLIYALNNYGSLTKAGSGVYHYQPKVQTPEEALIVEKIIRHAEDLLGVTRGTIKIKALYEEGRAGLSLPAIMWVWRHRLIGTNVGRWDYLGSLIEKWMKEAVFPDPQTIGMVDPRLMTYQRVNALWNLMVGMKDGKLTNAAPIGGMAAVMLYPKSDPYGRWRWNPKALRQMKMDKLRERLIGLIFVPNEPLADGRQLTLVEALKLERQGKGRFYDTYRQSWVATPDKDYVAAGTPPLRAALDELQAIIDAPVKEVTIEGTDQKVPTVDSGLTDSEKQAWHKLGLLNEKGEITPWVIRKEMMDTPEKLFSAEFWGGKNLWDSLYAPPAVNAPGENDPAKGHITIEHIQNAFYQEAQYGFQILNANYAAAIDDYEAWPGDQATGYRRFMNDLATYRIYNGFTWTVFHHQAAVTKDGWLKAPKLTENGVIPGENAVFLKAGTKMTPEIFEKLWDLHNQWTEAFFADFDRRAAADIVRHFWGRNEKKEQIEKVSTILSKAYAKGPFKELSLKEASRQVLNELGLRTSWNARELKDEIATAAPQFDRSQASVIMDVLKRQHLSPRYLQHSPRVLFEIMGKNDEERAQILDAIFSPNREAVVAKVKAGEWTEEALKAHDYVYDIFPEEEAPATPSPTPHESRASETSASRPKVIDGRAAEVVVRIPEWLQEKLGEKEFKAEGVVPSEVVIHLVEKYPKLGPYLFNDQGVPKQELVVLVNQRKPEQAKALSSSDVITLELPSDTVFGSTSDSGEKPEDQQERAPSVHPPVAMPPELQAEINAAKLPSDHKQRKEAMRKEWNNPRWDGLDRPYTEEDVIRVQGEKNIAYTLANNGSGNLWNILTLLSHVVTFGITMGIKAQQLVKSGFLVIYYGGWNAAAMKNTARSQFSDQSIYPSNTGAENVTEMNNFMESLDTMNPEKDFGKRAQKPSWWKGSKWIIPIVGDLEAGFGGILNVFHAVIAHIKAGVAGLHLEDQNAMWKKCGHMLGKVLDPTMFVIQKFIAMRFAADVMGIPLVIIGRTDADAARLVTSDSDPYDRSMMVRHGIRAGQFFNGHLIKEDDDAYLFTEEDGRLQFVVGDRNEILQADQAGNVYAEKDGTLETLKDDDGKGKPIILLQANRFGLQEKPGPVITPERLWQPQKGLTAFRMTHNRRLRDEFGMYVKNVGTGAAIHRGLAYAPWVDLLWFETKTPDLAEAKRFADAIHAKYPGKMLAYNLSGNMDWTKHFKTAEEAQKFTEELGKLGYKFQFNTTGEFWLEAGLTLIYALLFNKWGMKAFYRLQKLIKWAERTFKFQFRPQEWSTVAVQDHVTETVTGATHLSAAGDRKTGARSTEEQFETKKDSEGDKTPSLLANIFTGRHARYLNLIPRILVAPGIVTHEFGHFLATVLTAVFTGKWNDVKKVRPWHFFSGMPFETEGFSAAAGLIANGIAIGLLGAGFMQSALTPYLLGANILTALAEFLVVLPYFRTHPHADLNAFGKARISSDA